MAGGGPVRSFTVLLTAGAPRRLQCAVCACGPLCGRRENNARDRARVVRRSPALTRAVGNASQSPRIGTRRSARRAQRVVPMGRSPGRMYFIAGRTAWALGAFVGRQACSCGVWLKWEWERTPPESSSVNGSAPLVIIYIRRDTAVTLIVLLRTCYGLWLRAHAWRSFKIIVS